MGAMAMSMMWMRMPGQTWMVATASFVGMWMVMMMPMMLPSLAPTMWRSEVASCAKLALIGLGYFFVWAVVGLAVFPFGVALATVEQLARCAGSHAHKVGSRRFRVPSTQGLGHEWIGDERLHLATR